MGRTIVADETVQKTIDSFYLETGWILGLIIGQSTPQKDYIVHLSKTPPPDDDSCTASLDSVSDKWVANHAKQVVRMLPGGFDILGVFVVANQNETKLAQAKLRQVLFAVFKTLTKNTTLLQTDQPITDRILLHICAGSRKLTCRTYDVADHKSEARPAEWKSQSFADKWSQLQTQLALEVVIPVPHPIMDHSILNKQIQAGLRSTCQSIEKSLATVGGVLRNDQELLEAVSDRKRAAKKGAGEIYSIQLFTQTPFGAEHSLESSCSECGAKMLLRGTIHGRAYVHQKATVGDAMQAIKLDVRRSLLSRCELLCEDLLQTEEEQDPRVLYETPLRVFGKFPGLTLTFCDYMFPDESNQDLIDRCDELLGLNLTEEDLETQCEKLPNDEDVIKPTRTSDAGDPNEQDEVTPGDSVAKGLVGVAVSASVGVLAVALSYLYLGEP